MSLAGIADASAVDIGTAQTQTGNHHTVKKTIKVDAKHLKYVKKRIKKHKRAYKRFKRVKKTFRSKKRITRKVNKRKSVRVTKKKYRVYKRYKYRSKYKKIHKRIKKYRYKRVSSGSKKRVKRYRRSASNSSIKSLARSLSRGTRSQYQKGSKVFNWVKRHVRYTFYRNTRYGASGTLKYRRGNCADQSHLVVALARSSGLHAKYAHGKVRFRSGKVYGHVWALVKVNGKWYKADTTSKRNSFGRMSGRVLRVKGVYNRLPF